MLLMFMIIYIYCCIISKYVLYVFLCIARIFHMFSINLYLSYVLYVW